jgi:hypothetical protein
VLVPLAHASLLSGIALSLGTPWGLLRHYWVVFKLGITLFSTVILMFYMATFQQMAGVAADPVVSLGLVRNPSPLVHSILALMLLVAATVLSVYKPFGMTPYGQGHVGADRSVVGMTTLPNDRDRFTYGWWLAAVAAIALFVALHVLLGGGHGH